MYMDTYSANKHIYAHDKQTTYVLNQLKHTVMKLLTILKK